MLAKHDENYMPPEAAAALARAQKGVPQASNTLVTAPGATSGVRAP